MAGLLSRMLGLGGEPPALDETAWQAALRLPVFDGLTGDEVARLRELAVRLLDDKAINGAGEYEADLGMATVIAAFAALPVLNLGYGWYEGWREIVIYPGEFIHDDEETDEAGVVHHMRHSRSGESWEGGPMVLSWQDVEASGHGEGYNVVIHEFAHKLDMRDGNANGRPRRTVRVLFRGTRCAVRNLSGGVRPVAALLPAGPAGAVAVILKLYWHYGYTVNPRSKGRVPVFGRILKLEARLWTLFVVGVV